MECSEIRLKLDEYLENRLDVTLAGRIASHIEICDACREELGILREINGMLKLDRPVFAGADFTSSIMKKIEYEKSIEKKFFLKLPVINLGASLVLAGLLTIFISIPTINGAINKYAGDFASSAQSITSSINTTTGNLNLYIKNILNTGGN